MNCCSVKEFDGVTYTAFSSLDALYTYLQSFPSLIHLHSKVVVEKGGELFLAITVIDFLSSDGFSSNEVPKFKRKEKCSWIVPDGAIDCEGAPQPINLTVAVALRSLQAEKRKLKIKESRSDVVAAANALLKRDLGSDGCAAKVPGAKRVRFVEPLSTREEK